MTDTTRDLIQRLADALAEWQLGGAPPEDTADADLINEARAFLAQPEPEGVEDRPKPQSLKEESLELIDVIQACREPWLVEELCIVRRALEALPDD